MSYEGAWLALSGNDRGRTQKSHNGGIVANKRLFYIGGQSGIRVATEEQGSVGGLAIAAALKMIADTPTRPGPSGTWWATGGGSRSTGQPPHDACSQGLDTTTGTSWGFGEALLRSNIEDVTWG